MLEPLDRRHLLESLRPPADYELDQAIGTTYSLDLMTLLTVPLAFALRDIEDDDGKQLQNPLALLEAIRQYADRTHIFCQAGGIYLPKSNKLFLSHLESVVHEVAAPKGGVFHPKVWVLRFESRYEGAPVLYRLLVLSRNLTFDRSWDTLLLLEGELRVRERAIRQSVPLADFIAALPTMMTGQATKHLLDTIGTIAKELRCVQFDLPQGFEDMQFHPIGLRDTGNWWFDGRIDRMLTIAPFVDASTAEAIAHPSHGDTLVSQLEQLQQLPESAINCFKRVYFLPPDAEPEVEGSEDTEEEHELLSGLHAKLFVADAGNKARIWTGSANATTAATDRNVEFLVELTGKKGFCGVDAMLSQKKGETRFADLLSIYEPNDQPDEEDVNEVVLDRCKLQVRIALATAGICADVLATETDRYDVRITIPKMPGIRDVTELVLRVWPVTMQEHAARRVTAATETVFSGASFESLTSFFAFGFQGNLQGSKISDRFVLNLPVQGMPEDRQERILRSMFENSTRVLQFLLFLLAEDGDLGAYLTMGGKGPLNPNEGVAGLFRGTALLERLVCALHTDPTKLDRVASVVDDLAKTPEGQQLLPDGFLEIWEPIIKVRTEVAK